MALPPLGFERFAGVAMSFGANGPGDVSLGAADRAAAVAAVREWLRSDDGREDALIATLAESALGLCEQFIGQVTVAREMVATLPAMRGWQRIGATPVRAITGVTGLPAEGAAFALANDAYAIDLDADGGGWVLVRDPGIAGRVQVTLVAGLADGWDGLPAPVAQGAARLAAHWFNARDAAEPAPMAVTALWRPYRRMRMGGAPCSNG